MFAVAGDSACLGFAFDDEDLAVDLASQCCGGGQTRRSTSDDRNGDINKIPESAFPKAGPMPPIPESTDGATLDLPPDDLPAADALPDADAK